MGRCSGALVGAVVVLVLGTGCGGEPAKPSAPISEDVAIVRVIDGDTFATADGRTVHVAGIESCPLGTPGGELAAAAANDLLRTAPGGRVILGRSAGPDALPNGELLRSALVGGVDYGEEMLPAEHTGVGTGDVAAAVPAAYLPVLQAFDTRGSTRVPPIARDCSAAPPPAVGTTTSAPGPTTTVRDRDGDGEDERDRPYVPDPPRRTRDDSGSDTGSTSRGGSSSGDGHPCLPGERDGDKDGLCGES